MTENIKFPKDFLFGVATSAAQVEGAEELTVRDYLSGIHFLEFLGQ